MEETTLRKATVDDALFIAKGFHMAMLYEDTSMERLHAFAENICVRQDVLYSWCNTTIAEINGMPVGMVTSYDGRYYSAMRQQTMKLLKECFDTEFPGMEDEAVPGEYYIDSLAVLPEYRGMGIGRTLLQSAIASGKALSLTVTLAVEFDNTKAQHLYQSLGFMPDGKLFIFGHDYMKMKIPYRD